MDPGVQFTYIKVLKYGCKIKRTLFDKIIYTFTKRYIYRIEGNMVLEKIGWPGIHLIQKAIIELPSLLPPITNNTLEADINWDIDALKKYLKR